MTNTLKIGVTERGDAGLDLSWTNKMNDVNAAIIITKRVTDPAFQQAVLQHKDKIILHATITGNGHTIFEPNVPTYQESIVSLRTLIQAGFPAEQIVLRCDPIIPISECLDNMTCMLNMFFAHKLNITRIRVSVLDNYPHVRQRFAEKGIPVLYNGNFTPTQYALYEAAIALNKATKDHPEVTIETCAEPKLVDTFHWNNLRDIEIRGCCSVKDLAILGIDIPNNLAYNPQRRNGCCCLSCKTELLTNPKPCPHHCLYCYWK